MRYSSPSRKPVLNLKDEIEQGLRDLIAAENNIEREKTSLGLKPDFRVQDFRLQLLWQHLRH